MRELGLDRVLVEIDHRYGLHAILTNLYGLDSNDVMLMMLAESRLFGLWMLNNKLR